MTKFLIIDDHPLFREALRSAVELAYPDAETLDAATIAEASGLIDADHSCDLALLDLNMPGVRGFEGLLHLRARFPRLPVMVVSGHEDARIVEQAIAYGAAGFVPKSARKATLAEAIRRVMSGDVFLPEGHEKPVEAATAGTGMLKRLAMLTPQQMRVLDMLRSGKLNKQIAYELQVGETTVKAHVSEILRKLGVVSRTQAVIAVNALGGDELFRESKGFGAS